jgi:DNA repair exonuclease SbcCD ATPase subunit
MSHNIEYFDYAEKKNRKQIEADLDTYVAHRTYQEGGHGTGGIRWLDHILEKDYDSAKKYIEDHDRGWYDCLAVKYYEPVNSQNDAKAKELHDAVKAAMDLYNQRETMKYPKTIQAAFITCKNCKSKINKEYIRANFCPVCNEDLRPEHILKSIEAAEKKYHRAAVKENDYRLKHSKKEVRWLVKIEYHT